MIDAITGPRARDRARLYVSVRELSMHMVHIAWTLADYRSPRNVSLSTVKRTVVERWSRTLGLYVLLTYHSISISVSLVTDDCSDKSLVPARGSFTRS